MNDDNVKVLSMHWSLREDNFTCRVHKDFSPKKRKVRTGPDVTFKDLTVNQIPL